MQNMELIGQGAFSKVYKIKDANNKVWAVKHMKLKEEDEGIPFSALRQVTVLKHLKPHPNIIEFGKVDFQRTIGHTQVRIYFNYYEKDLKKFVRENQNISSLPIIKKIMKEILTGLNHIHSSGVVHRDIKPQNVLIDQKGAVRICDFGLARIILPTQKVLTRQIQTLYYRAPQIMLGKRYYDKAVDIWGTGCIFAQLFLKHPLFLGGYTQIEQIFKIFEIMGTPRKQKWPQFTELQDSTPRFPKWQKQPLKNIIKQMPESGLDLLQKMLQYNPAHRITAKAALEHQFFNQ